MSADIAIIISSFNRLSLLKECLTTLAKWLSQSEYNLRCTTVVYDAGSTDRSLEWLYEKGNALGIQLKVITPEQGDDTSFAAGINTAVKYAEEKNPTLSYLLFYETDNQI